MVVDSKQSQVSLASRKWQRMELPKVRHAACDILELMKNEEVQPGEEPEHMVADIKDAFFLLPNYPSERRFFVVSFKNKYYTWLKVAQGSTAAPLTWARVAAAITRMTMAILRSDRCRMSTYVDDPLLSCFGSPETRRQHFAITLLTWGALRLPLSLSKAKLGKSIMWISGCFTKIPRGIRVTIKQELLDDVKNMIMLMLSQNLVKVKKVESLDGKLVHISSLVKTVRPFLTDLRGAIHSKNSTAPQGMIWVKQIRHVLPWAHALVSERVGKLQRDYFTAIYHGIYEEIEVNLDASP